MASAQYDLLVEQGQDHRFVLVVENLDLTGYTAEMQIRKTLRSDTFDLELTDSNSKIVIETNTLYLIINDQDSFLIENNSVYDLFIESPLGDRKRLINGKICVAQAVTR